MSETVFFKREKRNIHGLTEEQLREAFDIYEQKVSEEVIEEIENEYGVKFEEKETRDLISRFISKGILKGMELSQNTELVTDYYKEVKKIENDKRVGVIDKTDNQFYASAIGKHWDVLKEVMEDKYPDKFEALIFFTANEEDSFENFTRNEIDSFILDNFEFKGNSLELRNYVKK